VRTAIRRQKSLKRTPDMQLARTRIREYENISLVKCTERKDGSRPNEEEVEGISGEAEFRANSREGSHGDFGKSGND